MTSSPGSSRGDRGHESLRTVTSDDAEIVAEIYNQAVAVGNATMDDAPKSVEEMGALIARLGSREIVLVLETPANQVLGWGIIKRYSDRPGYRFTCETSVYLRQDEVGKGYGTKVKKALVARCRDLGYHHLVAKIFADNVASIEYNLKQGYELVGVQREIGFKNGRWQDVAILQLVLDDVIPELPVG